MITIINNAMRQTKQRKIILETLKENRCHPDADFIYQKLKPEYPELSLGTVYRNLNLLSSEGIIQRVVSPSERVHYDAFIEPHYHFYCTLCGRIYDLEGNYSASLDNEIQEKTMHQIVCHETIFHGICETCLNKKNLE